MRFASFLACVGLLLIASPAHAQVFLITVQGTWTSSSGAYSTIPSGTAFTFTQTFNVSNAQLVSSDATDALYIDPTGTSSITFGSTTLTGTGPEISVSSNEPDQGSGPLFGYEFIQTLPSGVNFGAELESFDPSVAPTTSLASVKTFPISDFISPLDASVINDTGADFITGPNSFFSVQIESAPEPSAVILFPLGLILLGYLRHKMRRAGIST